MEFYPTTSFCSCSNHLKLGSQNNHKKYNVVPGLYLCPRAPGDCLQWFTGTSGTITSFAFQTQILIKDHTYNSCIRTEVSLLHPPASTAAPRWACAGSSTASRLPPAQSPTHSTWPASPPLEPQKVWNSPLASFTCSHPTPSLHLHGRCLRNGDHPQPHPGRG